MAAVSTSLGTPYESRGFAQSGRSIQTEAKGFVMYGAQSAQEILNGVLNSRAMNYESMSFLTSNTITSMYEFLLSVKAIF